MEHPELLRSQIKESCKLALPEGLKDLMSDITREVLRAQPPNIYTFITEYLSALLITRTSLTVASKICRDVCECSCLPHLEDELTYVGLADDDVEHVKNVVYKYFEQDEALLVTRASLTVVSKICRDGCECSCFPHLEDKLTYVGLADDDVEHVKGVVYKYFEMDEVKETNLLMKLFQDTNMDEDTLKAIQQAVRRAYLRHQMDHPRKYEIFASSLLLLYKYYRYERDKANMYMARSFVCVMLYQIFASSLLLLYKYYRDERDKANMDMMPEMPARAYEGADNTLRIYLGSGEDKIEKATKIQALFRGYLVRKNLRKPVSQGKKNEKNCEHNKLSFSSVSSQSLAGSFLHLPKHVPYSALYMSYNESEEYYHNNNLNCTQPIKNGNLRSEQDKKKIGFNSNFILHEIEPCPKQNCEDDDDKSDIEEYIQEEKSTEENVSDICDDIEELSDGSTGNIDDEVRHENGPKVSFSRDLVKKNKGKDEEKDVKYLMNYGDQEDVKSSENGSDNKDLNFSISNDNLNVSDEEINYPKSKDSKESLNHMNRDYSIMIKQVHEVSDLKLSPSKVIIKNNAHESDEDFKFFPKVDSNTEVLADVHENVIQEKRYSVNSDQ